MVKLNLWNAHDRLDPIGLKLGVVWWALEKSKLKKNDIILWLKFDFKISSDERGKYVRIVYLVITILMSN